MLRKAVVESKAAPKTFAAWNLTFEVSAPDWLGGATHQLVENGASIAVNQSNVHECVSPSHSCAYPCHRVDVWIHSPCGDVLV
jgi:hypothetical protein